MQQKYFKIETEPDTQKGIEEMKCENAEYEADANQIVAEMKKRCTHCGKCKNKNTENNRVK